MERRNHTREFKIEGVRLVKERVSRSRRRLGI